jgi:hypothetical protein
MFGARHAGSTWGRVQISARPTNSHFAKQRQNDRVFTEMKLVRVLTLSQMAKFPQIPATTPFLYANSTSLHTVGLQDLDVFI